ncbi:MAG: methyl-accepting chemotaxis protein [Methylococcaceae bacterium]
MLNNVTIRARLFSLIAFFALILAAIGFIGLKGIVDANNGLKAVYEDRTIPLGYIAEIQSRMSGIISELYFADMHDPAFPESKLHAGHPISKHTDKIEQYMTEVGQLWVSYAASSKSPDEKSIADEFSVLSADFIEFGAKPATAIYKGTEIATGYAFLGKEVNPRFEKLKPKADELVKLEVKEARQEFEKTTTHYANIRFNVLLLVALAIIGAVCIGLLLIRGITHSLHATQKVADAIAAGNLNSVIDTTQQDEIGGLLRTMDTMQSHLRTMIGHIASNSHSIAATAHHLSVLAEQVKTSSTYQNSASQSVASAVEEMTANIAQIAENAETSETLVSEAGSMASEGFMVVNDTTNEINKIAASVVESSQMMSELSNNSKKISDVIDVIRGIAKQTNLLALNAAIEAARAGERGKGFAVVADEVRNLAARTAQSTQEVTAMIKAIQSSADNAVDSMQKGSLGINEGVIKAHRAGESMTGINEGVIKAHRAGESMTDIKASTDRVIAKAADMSMALREQNSAVNQIAQDVEQIAAMVQHNNLAVKDLADTANSLNTMAVNLQSNIDQFKV